MITLLKKIFKSKPKIIIGKEIDTSGIYRSSEYIFDSIMQGISPNTHLNTPPQEFLLFAGSKVFIVKDADLPLIGDVSLNNDRHRNISFATSNSCSTTPYFSLSCEQILTQDFMIIQDWTTTYIYFGKNFRLLNTIDEIFKKHESIELQAKEICQQY